MTPLHYAAAGGNVELTELLLKNGANPNAVAADGNLPLNVAYRQPAGSNTGRPGIPELLLKYGADELLVRRQTISVNRSGRNFEQILFRKGTNELNRYSLFELFATLYAGEDNSPFPI
jgi:ankyrin repeat protein